jgi:S1-C subfamily serine protease
VIAIGAPKGLSFTVTDGIVSAVRSGSELAEFGGPNIGTWVQTSAPISSGNSGGPLLTQSGEVVGMNTLALTNAQNLNFAISGGDIRDVLARAKEGKLIAFSRVSTVGSERAKAAPARHLPDFDGPEVIVSPDGGRAAKNRRRVDDANKAAAAKGDEENAESLLKAAKPLLTANKKAAHERLKALIAKYPDTQAAKAAAELLKK